MKSIAVLLASIRKAINVTPLTELVCATVLQQDLQVPASDGRIFMK